MPFIRRPVFGRDAEAEQIRKLLAARQNILLLGPSGSGTTALLRGVACRWLDEKSIERFGPDETGGPSKRLWYEISPIHNLKELRNFRDYLSKCYKELGFPALTPTEVRRFMRHQLFENISWMLRKIHEAEAPKGYAFYLVMDDIEKATDLTLHFFRVVQNHVVIVASAHPVGYGERKEPVALDISFSTIQVREMSRKSAARLADETGFRLGLHSAAPNGLHPNLWKLLRTKVLSQVVSFPKAIVRMLEYSAGVRDHEAKAGGKFMEADIRQVPLHRCGVFDRDLTAAMLLIVFGFVAMRFLTMRTFERWLYGVYAVLSFGSLLFYRVALRRLSRREDNEYVWTYAAGKEHPKWWPVMPLVHVAFSILLFNVLLATFMTETSVSAMAVCAVTSLLPDLDIPTSTISRFWAWLWRRSGLRLPAAISMRLFNEPPIRISDLPAAIERTVGHRTLLHSAWAAAFCGLVALPLFWVDWRMWLAAPIGWLGHSLYDALSPSGVKLFWPSRVSYGMPAPLSWRIPVGSGRELIFALFFVVPFCLAATYTAFRTIGGIYVAATKDPNALVKEAMKRLDSNEVFVRVHSGFWRVNQTPIVNERFRVVAIGQNSLYIERGEETFRIGPDNPNSAIVLHRATIETGKPVAFRSGRVSVSEFTDLGSILRQIPDGARVSAVLSVFAEAEVAQRYVQGDPSEEFRSVRFREVESRNGVYEMVLTFARRDALVRDLEGAVFPLLGEVIWVVREVRV